MPYNTYQVQRAPLSWLLIWFDVFSRVAVRRLQEHSHCPGLAMHPVIKIQKLYFCFYRQSLDMLYQYTKITVFKIPLLTHSRKTRYKWGILCVICRTVFFHAIVCILVGINNRHAVPKHMTMKGFIFQTLTLPALTLARV